MLNLSTQDHVSNEELYRLTDQQSISSLIRMHRLTWLGHLARRLGRGGATIHVKSMRLHL